MGQLTIKGDKKQLEVIMRENRIRASRYGLKMSMEEPKAEKPQKEVEKPVKQQAKSGSDKTTGKK